MRDFMVKWGELYWTLWFFVALPITFAIPEAMAIAWGGHTLSSYTWVLSQKWPPIIFILGMLVGGLMVHFWWHWSPPTLPGSGLSGTGG